MDGREQKEHFPFGSILEERIVRGGLIHKPGVRDTSTFREFPKRRNDGSTLFRTALLVPSPETRSCVSWALAGP